MPEGATASLGEIVGALGGELIGDPAARIDSLAPIDSAGPGAISFVANRAYVKRLAASLAGCVIVAPAEREIAAQRGAAIVTDDPYLYYAKLSRWWAARQALPRATGIDARAAVDASATVAADAHVAAFAVIEADVTIEAGATVGAHAFVGAGSRIGAGSRLAPHTTLMARTTLGARCIIHSGAVLGADGFGFAPTPAGWEKIEQLGRVVVGDDVEIGANSCIDRGALGDTVIGDGVKIDNLVQIGHNVRIGAHTAIAGCVGIAGSTSIGARCMIGGGAGIIGHATIVDDTIISAATQVTRSITRAGTYSGLYPFDDNAEWEKNAAVLRSLYRLRSRVKALENKP